MCLLLRLKKHQQMKKLIIVSLGIFFALSLFGQKEEVALDTIYKLGQRKLVVDIRKVTDRLVTYVDAESGDIVTLERKMIQRVVYNSGKIEVFNKPLLMMVEEYSWEAVLFTEDPLEVKNLYHRGTVKSKSSPSSRSPKAAKKSCSIKLRKRAANLKGNIILVTKKEATGGYGEMPGYYMEGEVYGYEEVVDEEESAPPPAARNSVKGGVVL